MRPLRSIGWSTRRSICGTGFVYRATSGKAELTADVGSGCRSVSTSR